MHAPDLVPARITHSRKSSFRMGPNVFEDVLEQPGVGNERLAANRNSRRGPFVVRGRITGGAS